MDPGVAQGSYRYFVSLDFGTHGSGFAYSAKVTNWSGQRGSPAAKTRTALLYHKHDLNKPRAWGWAAIAEYGELSERERGQYILLESFKKYLMPKDFCTLSPLKLVSDFLSCLVNEVVLPTLKDHYGSRFHSSAVRWCLTVPAGLSQASMALMRKAAMAAGLVPSADSPALIITSEPEAAALTAKQHKDLLGLQSGGRLMIIDMGGGTVDMTIHKVDTAGDTVSLSELTHRECEAEGATRVDERFMQHLASMFGQGTFDRWRNDPANAADVQDLIYDEWETCKCSFQIGGTAGATSVNLPYTLFGTAGGSDRLILSPSTMMGFFRPSLSTITSTAHAMLARSGGANVVVLVGGFSASRFVTRELTAALEKHGMPVVAPDYGATAVLGGGVWLARYPGSVAARRACMTYGIRTAVAWEPSAPDKTYVQHKQSYVCTAGFTTYVQRDELVKAGSVVSVSNFSPLYPYSQETVFDIYGCLHKTAKYTTEDSKVKIASVVLKTPYCGANPRSNKLTAHFNFSETQISVRCVDQSTGKEEQARLKFDSSEVLAGAGFRPA